MKKRRITENVHQIRIESGAQDVGEPVIRGRNIVLPIGMPSDTPVDSEHVFSVRDDGALIFDVDVVKLAHDVERVEILIVSQDGTETTRGIFINFFSAEIFAKHMYSAKRRIPDPESQAVLALNCANGDRLPDQARIAAAVIFIYKYIEGYAPLGFLLEGGCEGFIDLAYGLPPHVGTVREDTTQLQISILTVVWHYSIVMDQPHLFWKCLRAIEDISQKLVNEDLTMRITYARNLGASLSLLSFMYLKKGSQERAAEVLNTLFQIFRKCTPSDFLQGTPHASHFIDVVRCSTAIHTLLQFKWAFMGEKPKVVPRFARRFVSENARVVSPDFEDKLSHFISNFNALEIAT